MVKIRLSRDLQLKYFDLAVSNKIEMGFSKTLLYSNAYLSKEYLVKSITFCLPLRQLYAETAVDTSGRNADTR